jgi:glycerophosphoryl diester phosphodiesterase
MKLSWLTDRPIAHRGLHSETSIENTQSAFAAALTHNYAIECDLQVSADGEAIVFHDDNVDRLLEGKGFVKSHSTKQLKALAFKSGSDRIQTLGELLEQVSGKASLVIELKTHWDYDQTLVRRTIEIMQGYKGEFGLMSFDPFIVANMAEIAPNIVRGITADRVTDKYYDPLSIDRRLAMRNFTHIERTKPDFISFDFAQLPFEPVAKLREAGLPVITWTIESERDAAQALKHCDQITFQGYLPA